MTEGFTRPGEPLPAAVEAACEHCLSCNACRSVCPVQLATNRLAPLPLLRMAALGLGTALHRCKEIWYCLQCNRCSNHCPVSVRPSTLIRRLREQAVQEGVVSEATLERFEALQARFQRVRRQMIARRAEGAELMEMAQAWRRWSEEPAESSCQAIAWGDAEPEQTAQLLARHLGFTCDLSACMTCGACTSVCPVTHDRSVYDPVVFFRLLNLGQGDEVLGSPALWLCLGCQACTDACTQQVPGHMVIRALQEEAVARGLVPRDIRTLLWAVDHALLPRYLEEVEALFETEDPG